MSVLFREIPEPLMAVNSECSPRFPYVINEDKSIYFVPYGNKLDVLMRPENQIPHLEDKVKSRFNQYYQDEQYLWKIDSIMLIDDLVKNYFSAEKELLIPATKEYPDNYNNIDLGV